MGMKYFPDSEDYPDIFGGEILPEGNLWCYVSSSFLNGLVNYVTPVKSYVINRYRDWNDERDGDILELHCCPEDEWIHKEFKTKEEIYQFVLKNPKTVVHTKIDIFDDDVLLLGRVKSDPNKYVFFWFDRDVSDCCIGMFKTQDSEAEVVEEFRKYVMEQSAVMQQIYLNKIDGCSASELPVEFFNGWISF